MAASMGGQKQFGAGASSPVTEKYELIGQSGLKLTEEFFHSEGITGTRSHNGERTRQSLRRVGGSLVFHPNSVELDAWLPRILGGTESANTFPVAETLSSWYWSEDLIEKVHNYSGCVAGRTTFRSVQGGPLEMIIEVAGTDLTVAAAATFPSLSLNTATGPYMWSDCVVTFDGVSYRFRSWELVIDNVLDTERFFNSLTVVSIPTKDRRVTMSLDGPWGDNYALYNLGTTGAQVVTTFTNGARSVAFSCVKFQAPRETPDHDGKEELMLPIRGVCRTSGGTKEIVVSNVS